jgi:hypothetical protein
MVGFFLALLELIRENLISIEQLKSEGSFCLKALTEKPPEQAVQEAILASAQEENQQFVPDKPQPSIPITELPAQKKDGIASRDSAEKIELGDNDQAAELSN